MKLRVLNQNNFVKTKSVHYIILPFYNHASFITSKCMGESKQQQRTTDTLQFNINQVMKVKLSRCNYVCHCVRRLKTLELSVRIVFKKSSQLINI